MHSALSAIGVAATSFSSLAFFRSKGTEAYSTPPARMPFFGAFALGAASWV